MNCHFIKIAFTFAFLFSVQFLPAGNLPQTEVFAPPRSIENQWVEFPLGKHVYFHLPSISSARSIIQSTVTDSHLRSLLFKRLSRQLNDEETHESSNQNDLHGNLEHWPNVFLKLTIEEFDSLPHETVQALYQIQYDYFQYIPDFFSHQEVKNISNPRKKSKFLKSKITIKRKKSRESGVVINPHSLSQLTAEKRRGFIYQQIDQDHNTSFVISDKFKSQQLPKALTELLGSYCPLNGPNCFYAAIKASGLTKKEPFYVEDLLLFEILKSSTISLSAGEPLEIGDVFVFSSHLNEADHAAVFVGMDSESGKLLLFTKNGLDKFSSFNIQTYDHVVEIYFQKRPYALRVFRPVPGLKRLKAQNGFWNKVYHCKGRIKGIRRTN